MVLTENAVTKQVSNLVVPPWCTVGRVKGLLGADVCMWNGQELMDDTLMSKLRGKGKLVWFKLMTTLTVRKGEQTVEVTVPSDYTLGQVRCMFEERYGTDRLILDSRTPPPLYVGANPNDWVIGNLFPKNIGSLVCV